MKLLKEIGQIKVGNRNYLHGLFLCPVCGQEVIKIKKDGLKAKQCGRKCYAKNRERRGNYKSKVISKKYIYLYNPRHPHAIGTKKLYVAEHRLVMENYISRYLNGKEIVHHKNGNTLDNDINNLELMTASEHSKLHANKKRRDNGRFTI